MQRKFKNNLDKKKQTIHECEMFDVEGQKISFDLHVYITERCAVFVFVHKSLHFSTETISHHGEINQWLSLDLGSFFLSFRQQNVRGVVVMIIEMT